MRAALLLTATTTACDIPAATRLAWAAATRATLEAQNYTVAAGSLRYAPIGTISDPAGTRGTEWKRLHHDRVERGRRQHSNAAKISRIGLRQASEECRRGHKLESPRTRVAAPPRVPRR